MKRFLIALALVLPAPSAWAACSSPIAMLDATASTVNMDASAGSGTNCAPQQQLVQGGAVVAAANALFVQPGTGASFTVGGTVTANAGTNLNTSSLALETGGNLATLAGTVSASKVNVNAVGATSNASDGVATSATNGASVAYGYGFNGTTWDRLRTDTTAGLWTQLKAAIPAGTNLIGGVNTAQVNGVTTSTGTGAVGTGSQRVAVGTDTATIAGSAPGAAGTASANVVTVQGIASMTPLLVTPASNSAVNVAQFGGSNVVTGTGAGGSGIPRVTVSSDSAIANTGFASQVTNSTGAGQAVIGCDSHTFKHITSATDTLAVQGVTAKVVRICGTIARFSGSAAQTVFLENTASTNANCSSTLTQITGAWVGNATAPSGAGFNGSFWNGLANTAGNGLCINSTGTGGVDVDIWYEQS